LPWTCNCGAARDGILLNELDKLARGAGGLWPRALSGWK
jgi:hypothetical protein